MPAAVVRVRLVKTEVKTEVKPRPGWRLERGGKPYEVRGAGYQAGLDALVEAGGNAIRTWGTDEDTRALLDEAWSKGVSVTLGIWLEHVEDGFDYGDPAAVEQQLERARRQVERYKDHPALLMWGVGNEVELKGGDDPRIWRAIEDVARMIHEVDPNHPTMVVTAEIGETYHRRLKENCPSIDVWGINAYGSGPSIPARLTERGWTGPIALTEFGGFGDWERTKLPWGATIEDTSTEKAAMYRKSLQALRDDPRTVASFAFLWGRSERPTDTWYALLGPGPIRYEATDVLADLWGAPPTNRAPSIEGWSRDLDGAIFAPGAPIKTSLSVRDPEGDPIVFDWILHRDTISAAGAGPAVLCSSTSNPTFEAPAPTLPGPYRLLAVARDPTAGAAFATARFHVGPPTDQRQINLPMWGDGPFAPSGWMGDASNGGVIVGDCPPTLGYCTGLCRSFEVRRGDHGWSSIAWHYPDGNWDGSKTGVLVPKDARSVRVTIWGEKGGERVTIGVGNRDVDGFEMNRRLVLTSTPTVYRLNVAGHEWTDVVYGFYWASSPDPDEVVRFYLADLTWSTEL